ncbi:MFS transporter [Streptomyces sp. NPDC058374]|uniref:MFS transporter n=1 Tax=Streptomyces sp. NPDC058374 TaxID=3346466 RepID=UPI003657AE99
MPTHDSPGHRGAPAVPARPASYRTVLAVPEFRALLLAQTLATCGGVVVQLTLSVLVYARTGSALLASLAFALGFTPYLFGAALLSAVADRYPARDVLVACQALSCAMAAAMALPGLPVPALLALVLVLGIAAPVFQGARAAALPDLLPAGGYPLGRSLLRLVSQSTQVAGFAVGGLLLLAVPAGQALLASAAGFAVATLVLRYGTRRRAARLPAGGSVARASLAGVRRVLAVPGLRPLLLLTWLPPALAVAPEALAAPYAAELGAGPGGAALLLCAAPAGSVAGELLYGTLLSPRTRARLLVPSAVLIFVPLLGFAFRPGLMAATALLVLSGLGYPYAMALDQRTLEAAPAELRGRTLTLALAGLMAGQGLGFAAAGAAAEFLAPPFVVAGAGLLGLVVLAFCGGGGGADARTGICRVPARPFPQHPCP